MLSGKADLPNQSSLTHHKGVRGVLQDTDPLSLGGDKRVCGVKTKPTSRSPLTSNSLIYCSSESGQKWAGSHGMPHGPWRRQALWAPPRPHLPDTMHWVQLRRCSTPGLYTLCKASLCLSEQEELPEISCSRCPRNVACKYAAQNTAGSGGHLWWLGASSETQL